MEIHDCSARSRAGLDSLSRPKLGLRAGTLLVAAALASGLIAGCSNSAQQLAPQGGSSRQSSALVQAPAATLKPAAGGEPSGTGPSPWKATGSVKFQIQKYYKYGTVHADRSLIINLCSSDPTHDGEWTPFKTGNIVVQSVDGRKLEVTAFGGFDTNFPKVSDALITNGGSVPLPAGCSGQQKWELVFDDPSSPGEPKLGSLTFRSDQGASTTDVLARRDPGLRGS